MPGLLDLDQLRTFIAISDSGGFTAASEAVHKTQSAVSMQMRRLEERIGKPVFERQGRVSRLTEDGERLLTFARRLMAMNDETLAAFDDTELAGQVRLGTPDDYADRFLPEILARFSRSNPRAEILVSCAPTPLLVENIRRNELDVAIVTHVRDKSREREEVVRREPLLWVSSARHCAFRQTPLPLALGKPTCDWRKAALAALKAQDRECNVILASWSSAAVSAAVTAGLAISVLPESALRPGMRVLSENDGFPRLPDCEIALLRSWHQRSPLINALGEHIVYSLDNLSIPTAAE
ncbi:MAG: LysR substrate-binding domain-containing protein [Stappiaceae bacterium]